MGRSQEQSKSSMEQSRSVECSITLRGFTAFFLFGTIGFMVGAGNFQEWFQGEQI